MVGRAVCSTVHFNDMAKIIEGLRKHAVSRTAIAKAAVRAKEQYIAPASAGWSHCGGLAVYNPGCRHKDTKRMANLLSVEVSELLVVNFPVACRCMNLCMPAAIIPVEFVGSSSPVRIRYRWNYSSLLNRSYLCASVPDGLGGLFILRLPCCKQASSLNHFGWLWLQMEVRAVRAASSTPVSGLLLSRRPF